MLARVVFDDPVSVNALPDAAERARLLHRQITAYVRYAHLFGVVDMVPGRPDALAAWLPPVGVEETPERLVQAGLDRAMVAVGKEASDRFAAMFAHMEERMNAVVPVPHWYLFILGVDPTRQDQGLGSVLSRAGLRRAAADGTPACLLTMGPRNVAFYQKNGMRIAYDGIEPTSRYRFWVFTKDPPSPQGEAQ